MKILVDTNVIIDALTSREPFREDAVISCCSLHSQMDYIVTRNIKDYEMWKVQAILPDQLLKIVSQNDA